jgi:hypothetical protein
MSVVLTHSGGKIRSIRGTTHQYPWSTCPEATKELAAFIDLDLDDAARLKAIDQHRQCTHLMDLARLAAQQAGRDDRRRYHLAVRRIPPFDRDIEAIALVNGRAVLNWIIAEGSVTSPPMFYGLRVEGRANLPTFCREDPELMEVTMMLIRAVKMFAAREKIAALPPHDTPSGGAAALGACFTLQSENIVRAYRASSGKDIPR